MKLYQDLKIQWRLLRECRTYYRLIRKYNASVHPSKDIQKMQYRLLRENHVIEKGMSMRNPRDGFGQKKIIKLLDGLDLYFHLYSSEDLKFLEYPLSTIMAYIESMQSNNVAIPIIEEKFNTLLKKTGLDNVKVHAGVKEVSKEEILKSCNNDFKSLLNSRHSIRYFSKEQPDKSLIEEALNISKKTPSACNRQAWATYVFFEEKSYDLIKWQGGARGFEEEIHCSILITANLKAFLEYEIHQAYVDGGLYAMNLINSLHFLGLGTIPLSCGFGTKKLQGLKAFRIPEYEVPIAIIGTGKLLDNFNVAISSRKSIEETNKWI